MTHVFTTLLHLYTHIHTHTYTHTHTHIPLQSLGDGRQLDLESRYTF